MGAAPRSHIECARNRMTLGGNVKMTVERSGSQESVDKGCLKCGRDNIVADRFCLGRTTPKQAGALSRGT